MINNLNILYIYSKPFYNSLTVLYLLSRFTQSPKVFWKRFYNIIINKKLIFIILNNFIFIKFTIKIDVKSTLIIESIFVNKYKLTFIFLMNFLGLKFKKYTNFFCKIYFFNNIQIQTCYDTNLKLFLTFFKMFCDKYFIFNLYKIINN